MKNKGFTLIELLGVIIILALLMIIVFPSIVNSVKNSSKKTDDLTLELIYNAADLFISDHIDDFSKNDGNKYVIELKDLVDEGFLVSPIKLSNSDDITNTKCVQVTYDNGYKYELKESGTCEKSSICMLSDADNDDIADVGEVVTCTLTESTDKFYVIKETSLTGTSTSLQMLTEMNIHTTEYRQSEDAGTIAFSTTNYWDDSIISEGIIKPLPQYGTTYPTYVYDDNSLVKPIVDEYVKYLNTKLTNATGSLLTEEQRNELYTNHRHSKWAYSPHYWTGVADHISDVFVSEYNTYEEVGHEGGHFHPPLYYSNYGVRPVITISTSQISSN